MLSGTDGPEEGQRVSAGIALVRRPSRRLAEGLVTHIERLPVEPDTAQRQWQAYVDALGAAGWDVREVPVAEDCPDSVFVEDAVVVFDDLAVVTRPGAQSRRPETRDVEPAVAELGLPLASITDPGTLDGGDVLKIGRTAYVGRGGRTNDAAIDQLRALLTPRGWTVVPVDLTKVLHLKSAVTALPDGTVIGYRPLVDDPSVFPAFRDVPEEAGSHVVLVGGNRLLMSAKAPATAELFRDWGYEPVPVDIGEFEKLEGCVTCLSVRVRSAT
jgi:dimethylargininase